MENNEDQIIDAEIIDETETKKSFKEILKEKSFEIGIAVAGLALTAWGAYESNKRADRKEQAYYGYLEDKTELQREALGAYKDSLEDPRTEMEYDKIHDSE